MDKYAVVGNPVQHSKSPEIHSAFAKQMKQAMEYSTLLSEAHCFEQDLQQFFAEGGTGLNVTLPFKLKAFEFADELTPRAKQAEAVNTLVKRKNGSILGDNTDGIGLVRDLQDNLQQTIKQKRILLLGAGGAVQGVLSPLLAEKPNEIIISNRTFLKAQNLAHKFSGNGNIVVQSFEALSQSAEKYHDYFDMIINGSSASLAGEVPDIDGKVVSEKTFCYDMMYQKGDTPFIAWAKNQGCKNYSDGLGMLVEQAAESFYVWRKCRPQTKPVIKKIRLSLSA